MDSRTQPIAKCTLPLQSPQSSMVSPKSTKFAPPKAHSVQQGIHHIWGGKGVGKHHPSTGGPVTTSPQKHPALHTKNTSQTGAEEVISSYDVKALFTSVPVGPSITIVKQRLTQDPILPQRTQMSIPQIATLMEFCLKIPTSSSRVSIMNRSMVQPWVPPSVP